MQQVVGLEIEVDEPRSSTMIVLPLLAACSREDPSTVTPSTSGQEALDPSDDCVDYVACALAADPDNADLVQGTYGEAAECWTAGDPEALACTQACPDVRLRCPDRSRQAFPRAPESGYPPPCPPPSSSRSEPR